MNTFRKDIIDWVINFAIALILLSIISLVWGGIKSAYYEFSDTSIFYQNHSFSVGDVCLGEDVQTIVSIRSVSQTKVGYPISATRELLTKEGNQVFSEQSVGFAEADSTISIREGQFPLHIGEGEYYWNIYPRVDVEGHIKIVDTIRSNNFKVSVCE